MFGFHSFSERPFSAIEPIVGAPTAIIFADSNINVENRLGILYPASLEGLMNGLIAYWKLDEDGGTRADSHGRHHLSDFNTTPAVGGIFNNAANPYYGSKEYLYKSSHPAFNPTGDFSVAGWFWFHRHQPLTERMIFAKTEGSSANWLLKLDSLRRLNFSVSNGSISGSLTSTLPGTTSYETWFYAIAGYDSRLGQLWLKIYDTSGTLLENITTAYTGGTNIYNVSPVTVGASWKSGSVFGENHWYGRIDEVGFWNKRLTTNDISKLINSGSYSTYPFDGHEGIQIEFFQLLSDESALHVSWKILVGKDGNPYIDSTLPISSRSDIKFDPEMPIENFVRGLISNHTTQTEFLHDTGQNFAPPIVFLSSIGPNFSLNLDWEAPIALDGVLDIEWALQFGVERSTYIGFLKDSGADSALATEILGSFKSDDIIPISFGGFEFVPGILKWTLTNNKNIWTLKNSKNTWTLVKRSSSASTN